jgi:hypothetical protein
MVKSPAALAGLQPVHGRDPFRRRYDSGDYCGADFVPLVGAGEPRDRSRPGRLDGDQEAGGILLDGHSRTLRIFYWANF